MSYYVYISDAKLLHSIFFLKKLIRESDQMFSLLSHVKCWIYLFGHNGMTEIKNSLFHLTG